MNRFSDVHTVWPHHTENEKHGDLAGNCCMVVSVKAQIKRGEQKAAIYKRKTIHYSARREDDRALWANVLVSLLLSRGCSYVSFMTHEPRCEKEGLVVPSTYVICLMGWPWVTSRRNDDDVPGRSEQFLHCGRDGAGWEQQPTSLLPTWGTKANHTHTYTDTQNIINKTFEKVQTSQVIISGDWIESSLQATDLIFLAGNWINLPISGL